MTKEEAKKMGATHYCDKPYVEYYYFNVDWFEWNERDKCWDCLHFNPKSIEI